MIKDKYPMDIKNIGDDVYVLMSKGHHDPHLFMQAVRGSGNQWPLGMPEHVWMRAIPSPKGSWNCCSYVDAVPGSRGAFPATCAAEAYGDDMYENLK